jgi:hypothetical protein
MTSVYGQHPATLHRCIRKVMQVVEAEATAMKDRDNPLQTTLKEVIQNSTGSQSRKPNHQTTGCNPVLECNLRQAAGVEKPSPTSRIENGGGVSLLRHLAISAQVPN